jgi:nitrogen fixation NifU-like protein
MSLDVYNETILAYAKNPPNKSRLENPSVSHHEENRTCGDSLEVFLKIDPKGIIEDFGFVGDTAIVTTAAAAMFGESIVGLSIMEILMLKEDYIKNTL